MFKKNLIINTFIMKNFKLANFIDIVFVNFLFFLIAFTWIKFFNKNISYSFFLTTILLIIFNILLFFYNTNKKNKRNISKKLDEDIEQYMLTFLSNTNDENLKFFNTSIKKENSKILLKQNLIIYHFNNEKLAISPVFNNKNIIFEDCLRVLSYTKQLNIKKLYILCYNCDSKTKILLNSFKDIEIKVLDKKLIYLEILKKTNLYPKIKFEYKNSKKLKFKQIIDISFNKSRAKGYFLSGILTFFCSFIVKYNFYYVFMSSILFLFTIFCFIKKQETINKDFF